MGKDDVSWFRRPRLGRLELSVRDGLLLLLPVGWGLTCLAAVIAYGARGRTIPAISALLSALASLLLSIDVWVSHKTTRVLNNRDLEKAGDRTSVLVKLGLAILLFVSMTATSIYFVLDRRYHADLIWTLMATALSVVWIIDLVVFHWRSAVVVA